MIAVKYGYYLDQGVGAESTAIIGLGLGLSAYVSLALRLSRRRVCAHELRPQLAVGRQPDAGRQLARRQSRRHARARARDPTAQVRLLPGPRRGRVLDGDHRPWIGTLALRLSRPRAGRRHRVSRHVDQRVSRVDRVRRLQDLLRPDRPDGGAAAPDIAEHVARLHSLPGRARGQLDARHSARGDGRVVRRTVWPEPVPDRQAGAAAVPLVGTGAMMPRFATMLVLVAALAAQSAVAQTVRGSLVDSVSRVPLPATLVTLIDESGTERAHAVSDQTGQYVLTAPAAGSYRIRAKRIGFRPLVSPALTLGDRKSTR